MRKSNLVGGLLLIFAGLVFMASNLGYIDQGFFFRLGQLWPFWLVVGGLMMLSRSYDHFRLAAGAVVVLMLVVAIADPVFLDSFHGYGSWRHNWSASSVWGLLFLVGSVWVLHNLFGRSQVSASK